MVAASRTWTAITGISSSSRASRADVIVGSGLATIIVGAAVFTPPDQIQFVVVPVAVGFLALCVCVGGGPAPVGGWHRDMDRRIWQLALAPRG